MEEDKFALSEKVIRDIHNYLSKIIDIDTFDIVPVDTNIQNRSPVLHLENCLGLETWCVKHVYMYCYSELMNLYGIKKKQKTFKLSINSDRIIMLLNVIILLNPEVSLYWNKRREMVLKYLLDTEFELHFTRLVLSRNPKCNNAFVYRRWLLDIIFKGDPLQGNNYENLINGELHICTLASGKCPNNYHSWNYRMWILNKMKFLEKQFNIDNQYIKEYNFSERWTSKHVSDFSCFHYRQFCIINIYLLSNESWKIFENSIDFNLRKNFVRVIADNFPNDSIADSESNLISYTEDKLIKLLLSHTLKSCNCIVDNLTVCRKFEILFHELVLNDELIRFYRHHETLWYHRRFIVHEIIRLIYEYYCFIRKNGVTIKKFCKKCSLENLWQNKAKMLKYDYNCISSNVLYNVLVSHERKFVMEMRSNHDSYAERHEKYLAFVEGIKNLN